MAILNLDYYDGIDYYSDGDIENVIEDIVNNTLDFHNAIDSYNSYPVLYHLSRERENILNWYPFQNTDDVLEVGAGCGAVTGLLCRLCHQVTSVELSRKRSRINYERNREYSNLEIIVGNLNHIPLEKLYDYVILNGVFEYAESFTDSEDSYSAFFCEIKKHVKRTGKILIAIENRLGIKYFSGAAEDHTNNHFVGLDNYGENCSVRTFSKCELKRIFQKCGMKNWKFYYPYPDYKFPTEIFTDENINRGSYGRPYPNYQKDQIRLFNELNMVQTLKAENIMGSFSNSFLVEICMEDSKTSNIVYAKLNNTRKNHFCIATLICNDDSTYHVKKIALKKEADAHIRKILQNQYSQSPAGFQYLQGNLIDGAIIYPYLNGDTLDVYLYKLILQNQLTEVLKEIDGIYTGLIVNSKKKRNFCCGEFRKYFGETKIDLELDCLKGCNIDLIFDNLYHQKGKYIIIDPEWVLDIWIPVTFILWRAINEWYAKHQELEQQLPKMQMYKRYNISAELSETYRKWALFFTEIYVSKYNLDQYVHPVKIINFDEILTCFKSKNELVSSLYINYDGKGYSEKHKILIKHQIYNYKFSFKIILNYERQITGLRLDPVEGKCCRCHVQTCFIDGIKTKVKALNVSVEQSDLFLTTDPQIEILMQPGYYRVLEISGEYEELDDNNFLEILMNKECQKQKLISELAENKKRNQLSEIKHSEMNFQVQKLSAELDETKNQMKILISDSKKTQKELTEIKSSREWKFIHKLKHLKKNT